MAETEPTQPAVLPAETPQAAPVAAAPAVPSPVETVTAPVTPVVEATPVVEPTPEIVAEPVVEAKPVEGPKLHTETATLLEEVGKEKKADEAKPGEVKPVDAPVAYQEFKLPEGLTADPQKMTAYTEVLGKYKIPQEAGQELIDLHSSAMQRYAEHLGSEQHRVFGETRLGWRKRSMGDEEFGGAGFQTSMGAIARMRDEFVSEKHRKNFDEMLRITGVGDHPEFLRIFYNIARRHDEPAMSPVNIRPPPMNGSKPSLRGRDMYDHPRSKHS